MTVVILRPFLMALPRELEEAALIDGASRVGIFWRLALPLSMPGAGHGRRAGVRRRRGTPTCCRCCCCRTTCVRCRSGVADYSTEHSADTAGVLAFTTLAMIPALILFLAMQRRIVSGLQGAVKG